MRKAPASTGALAVGNVRSGLDDPANEPVLFSLAQFPGQPFLLGHCRAGQQVINVDDLVSQLG